MFEFFSTKGFKGYVKQARKILDGNWTGRYTKPSPTLYPHQWNWDSGFMAIGYAHYNEERAMQEIRSLFGHQWENGMVPQIALASIGIREFRNYRWGSWRRHGLVFPGFDDKDAVLFPEQFNGKFIIQ